MSRHRLVRNINFHDELDDEALSDGGDDMTDEQLAQMESGLEHVRAVMGDEATSRLSDQIIKDALWEYYFDTERAISSLYEEQERIFAAKERKVTSPRFKFRWCSRFRRKGDDQEVQREDIPNLHEGQTGQFGSLHYPTGYYSQDMERPHVPLIVLAQQGQYMSEYQPEENGLVVGPGDAFGVMSPGYRGSRLSRITEVTERTEPSGHWPSMQQLVAMNNPRALSSSETTSSYGQLIDRRSGFSLNSDYQHPVVDPNEIPPSPSPSAVRQLSTYDSAPSMHTRSESEVDSEQPEQPKSTPRAPSVSVPPMENIPDISDFTLKSSQGPPVPPPKDPDPLPSKNISPRVAPPKRSKLATLASSRASAIASSRDSDLETTSVLTFPALRPSAESRVSLASRATSVKPKNSEKSVGNTSSIRTPSEKSVRPAKPPSTTTSSMSSHVHRAIQTAMQLEATEATPKECSDSVSEASSASTVKAAKPRSPAPLSASSDLPALPADEEARARPQSKLAKLAQAKANVIVPRVPKSITQSSPPKQLPKPHTEYLTPIANGPTATTAITTSYQSLHSLSSSRTLEQFSLIQMPPTPGRQSKLALKVKKGQDKTSSHSSATDDEGCLPSPPPLFLPKSTRSRKEKDRGTPKYGREELDLVDMYQASKSTLAMDIRHQRSGTKPVSPNMGVRSAFAFDVPSPDDIIFNARRGTSLAQRR
ncbi:hypothetical protein F5I97DRAFT_942982 [Phlebopus sp. FC_14]|nr:hypothetical protein F5I97DRAFT_942982 [Phlebopus sp. FC_14]